MAVTLYTELASLIYSSQILDIVIGTTTNDEVEVSLACPYNTIFSATHSPYGDSVKLHDLRSVVKHYFLDRNISLNGFELWVVVCCTSKTVRLSMDLHCYDPCQERSLHS